MTEIVKITKRPKTSVYAHIHTIPLSAAKKAASLRAQGEWIRQFAIKRRGLSARKFKRFSHWDKHTVRAVSHFIFDGEIKHGQCAYNNRNEALLQIVQKNVAYIYDFEPKRYFNKFTGVTRICYFNVAFSAYIAEKARLLLSEIHTLPAEYKREFLRAFFDDEGCMDFRPHINHRKVRGYQKNVEILHIVRKLLTDFDIASKFKLPNEVEIIGKENLEKFQKEIGFSPGVRINGKRSNSIWKQSLEKREILRRAIESYKPAGTPGVHRNVR